MQIKDLIKDIKNLDIEGFDDFDEKWYTFFFTPNYQFKEINFSFNVSTIKPDRNGSKKDYNYVSHLNIGRFLDYLLYIYSPKDREKAKKVFERMRKKYRRYLPKINETLHDITTEAVLGDKDSLWIYGANLQNVLTTSKEAVQSLYYLMEEGIDYELFKDV